MARVKKVFCNEDLPSKLHDNINGVIFRYSCPYPCSGERPIGCHVYFLGCFISASIFERGFRVYNNIENFSIRFLTLKSARNFCINRFNMFNSLF